MVAGDGHLPVPRERGGDPRARRRRRRRRSRHRRSRSGTPRQKDGVRRSPATRRSPAPRRADAGEGGRTDAGRAPRRGPAALGAGSRGRPRRRRRRAAGRHARSSRRCPCWSCRRPACARGPGARRRAGAPARPPRPARRGPARGPAPPVSRPTTRSGGSGSPDGTTIGALTDGGPRRARCTSRPSRPSPTSPRPWGMPWISDRLRAPDGCPWDREQTHAVAAQPPARGGLRGLRRARGAAPRRSSRASSATCCSRSSSTRSSPPRRACST